MRQIVNSILAAVCLIGSIPFFWFIGIAIQTLRKVKSHDEDKNDTGSDLDTGGDTGVQTASIGNPNNGAADQHPNRRRADRPRNG